MEIVVGSFEDLTRAQDAASAIMNTGTIAGDLDLMFMEGHDRIVTAELLDADDSILETSPVEPALQFSGGIPAAVPNTVAAASPNLLTGQGSFSNPGVAPALAIGALADRIRPRTAVAHHSADPRSMTQALVDESVPEQQIDDLAQQLAEGRVLLIAHVGQEKVPLVTQIIGAHGSLEPASAEVGETGDGVSFETDLVAPTEGTTAATTERQYAEAPAILGAAQGSQTIQPSVTAPSSAQAAGAAEAIDGASAGSNAAHAVSADQTGGPTVSGASADNPLIANDLLGDTNAGTRPPSYATYPSLDPIETRGNGLAEDIHPSEAEAAGAGSGF